MPICLRVITVSQSWLSSHQKTCATDLVLQSGLQPVAHHSYLQSLGKQVFLVTRKLLSYFYSCVTDP